MTLSMYGSSVATSRVGLVVEGEADVGAIPQLLRDSGIRLIRPVKFGGQPADCEVRKFCEFVERKIVPLVWARLQKQVCVVVVVIDRENRGHCPGEFAQYVAQTIVEAMVAKYDYIGAPPISVVCADRTLENWLIADPKGLHTHNYIDKDLSKAVGANADGKDALTLLKQAYRPGRSYDKRMDAPQLASKIGTMQRDVRRRSHSLDKLLRECGVPPLD